MNCCLWLNGVKVWNTRDIKNNFDPVSLHGYFRGGSLLRWLKANDGEQEARRLEETGNIAYAFGINEQLTVNNEQLPENTEAPVISSVLKTSWSGFGSGSGSGALGYGLHII
jgi:hypothetical protein